MGRRGRHVSFEAPPADLRHCVTVAQSVLKTSPLPVSPTSPVPRQEAIELGDECRVDLEVGAEGVSDGVDGYVELCRLRGDRAHCPWPASDDGRPLFVWRPSLEHSEVQAILLV